MVRSFLAINLSPEANRVILDSITGFRFLGKSVRWVRPENIHLTVKFLGDQTPSAIRDISAALQEVASGLQPFEIKIGPTGIFPSLKRPRVLWIGTKGNNEAIRRMHGLVEEALSHVGIEKDDRPFSPHITIGRIKGRPPSQDSIIRLLKSDLPPEVTLVDRFCLYQSRLTPAGPIYKPLSIHPFGKGSSEQFQVLNPASEKK
jgi:2'-5' RNA ligase